MVVKREAPSSSIPSEDGSPPSPATSDDTKPTPKRTKASPRKKASSSTPTKPRADDVITPDMKRYMMVVAMDLGYKQLPFNEFAKEFGISASRLKDQFKHGRSNLRQKAIECAGAGAKESK